jgi:hypothetical protein
VVQDTAAVSARARGSLSAARPQRERGNTRPQQGRVRGIFHLAGGGECICRWD